MAELVTRGLLENIVVTIVVGAPLSYWLAKVVNRLAAFDQIKVSAIREIGSLKKITTQSENYMSAMVQIRWLLEDPAILLGGEEQWDAMGTMITVRKEVREEVIKRFEAILARHSYTNRKQLQGGEWLKAQEEVFNDLSPAIRKWVNSVQTLQPDLLRIVGAIPRNRTLNQWEKRPFLKRLVPLFDVMRQRKRHWQEFRDYLDGKRTEL